MNEKPVTQAQKQVALSVELDALVTQLAKDMAKTQEKAMSVEFELAKPGVEQAQTSERAQEAARKPQRDRGMGLSL